jgi:hypothetical protein
MGRIDETDFYQHRWHFGVLEYIEVCSAPGTSGLGDAGANTLKEFFRQGLPLHTLAMIPDFHTSGLVATGTVRIWVGIEMYTHKYVAIMHIRDATPFRQGDKGVAFTGEYRNGLVIMEDEFDFPYDSERKIFLVVRRP